VRSGSGFARQESLAGEVAQRQLGLSRQTMSGRLDDDVGMIADHGNASLKARAAARLPSPAAHHSSAHRNSPLSIPLTGRLVKLTMVNVINRRLVKAVDGGRRPDLSAIIADRRT
jgi:hypothetical protein